MKKATVDQIVIGIMEMKGTKPGREDTPITGLPFTLKDRKYLSEIISLYKRDIKTKPNRYVATNNQAIANKYDIPIADVEYVEQRGCF